MYIIKLLLLCSIIMYIIKVLCLVSISMDNNSTRVKSEYMLVDWVWIQWEWWGFQGVISLAERVVWDFGWEFGVVNVFLLISSRLYRKS